LIQTNKRKFSKILVAIDGSETSLRAADYAIEIAAEEKEENNNNAALLIAIHILPSQIGYAYHLTFTDQLLPLQLVNC
jgi:nucleotide-binding universal stress UspA family protein